MPKKEDQTKKYKITESMFQDIFRNLKADNNIQPVKIFHECMDCAPAYVTATNRYHKDYKRSLNIINISENRQYILPEFIFLAYLKSIMEYDNSAYYPYNNNEIQQIIETVGIDSKSNFLNHITLFKIDYSINYIKEKTLNIIDNHFNFQTNFFNFLNHYNMIKNTTTDFSYAIPRTIAPVFIHIINAWDYSPISDIKKNIPIDKKGSKTPFNKFIEKVQRDYSNNFKPDRAYELFTKYFLYFFFANTYITPLVKKQRFLHHFEYSPYDATLLRNEWNKYDTLLYEMNQSVPYLALKRIFALNAYKLYNSGITNILSSQTDCTTIDDITHSNENFIKELKKETQNMINGIKELANNHLKTTFTDNTLNYMASSKDTYFTLLEEIIESYIYRLISLQDRYFTFLFHYIYFDHSTFTNVFNSADSKPDTGFPRLYSLRPDYNPSEPEPCRYKQNYEIHYKLMQFSEHISEFMEKTMTSHKEKIDKAYQQNKNFKIGNTLFTELKKINGFIRTLEKYLNNNPPIQEYSCPKYETAYDSFIYEMKIATNTYEGLFHTFYEKLTNLADKNPEIPLWHTLHLCIANNAESFEKIFKPS